MLNDVLNKIKNYFQTKSGGLINSTDIVSSDSIPDGLDVVEVGVVTSETLVLKSQKGFMLVIEDMAQ